jgi:hypothetical protein
MKKQTAVEWLVENVIISAPLNWDTTILEQAKEMELKQAHEYAEFAIRCDRKDMKILNFDGYMNLETFKSE